jgi:hypothetical protein
MSDAKCRCVEVGTNSYMRSRKEIELSMRKAKSAVTNGTAVLYNIDHRTIYMRRLRDLLAAHEQDLGGRDLLSEGQRCIIKRASMLTIQCELLETKFAQSDSAASRLDLLTYQTCANSLRGLVESLGLNTGRKQRPTNELDAEVEDAYMDAMAEPAE